MTEIEYNKYLKNKFQKEVEKTFNNILGKKFMTWKTKGKEVIKFYNFDIAFPKITYLCEFCEFDEETQNTITQLYEDLKQNAYFITLGMEKIEVVNAEFVKATKEKILENCK